MANPGKARDEFIEANGLRFHYREWGDTRTKHALVLLHGYAETSEVWNDMAVDLAREFRVIAIDQRGYGQSSRVPDHDYSRSRQIEDLEAIIEQLGLRSVTLVGHSMGGANAICYASEEVRTWRLTPVEKTRDNCLKIDVTIFGLGPALEGLRRPVVPSPVSLLRRLGIDWLADRLAHGVVGRIRRPGLDRHGLPLGV